MIGSIDERQPHRNDPPPERSGVAAAVWRRKIGVLLTTAVFGLATFAALSLTPPTFRAETRLLVEARAPDAAAGAAAETDVVESQIQLLTSRDLARRVADRLDLADRAAFDGSHVSLLSAALVFVGLGTDPMRVSPEERVLDAFTAALQVERVDGSRVLVVRFSAPDRDLAAAAANTVAEEYLALQSDVRRKPGEEPVRWLADEIDRLKEKLKRTEEAIAHARVTGVVDGVSGTSRQAAALAESLAAERARKATLQADAERLASVLQARSSLDAVADTLSSDTWRALKERELSLRNRLSELSVTLLAGHPQVRAVQSQLADVATQETLEARRILAGLRAEGETADERIRSLSAELAAVEDASKSDALMAADIRGLEREAAAERGLLETLEARRREAAVVPAAPVAPADARVLSRATTPGAPVAVPVLPLSGLAAVAGLLLSVGWVAVGAALSDRFRRAARRHEPATPAFADPADPVADALPSARPEPVDLPLAVAPAPVAVPMAPADPEPAPPSAADAAFEAFAAPSVADAAFEPIAAPSVADAAFEAIADALRAMPQTVAADPGPASAGVVTRLPPPPPRQPLAPDGTDIHAVLLSQGKSRVVVTGVTATDGVERVVAGFARLATAEGARVVVVDTVADHAGVDGAGLADLVDGIAAFDDIIRRNSLTRAHEIGVGSRPLTPADFTGEAVATVLTALEHTYDVVVLDLGLIEPDPHRFDLIATADHTLLVGDAEDPDVVQIHALMIRSGIEPVTIVPVPDEEILGVAA